MNRIAALLVSPVGCAMLLLPHLASAQTNQAIPAAITTRDKVETRIGTLDFKDGAPSKASLEKAYDQIDFYSPLEPFFTKQWRPSEIELIR